MTVSLDVLAALALEWGLDVALALLAIAFLLTLLRAALGPRLADRLLALQLGWMIAIGAISVLAMRATAWAYLDIALTLSLFGGLVPLASAFRRRRIGGSSDGEKEIG